MPKEQHIYDNNTGCHYQNTKHYKHHIGIPSHLQSRFQVHKNSAAEDSRLHSDDRRAADGGARVLSLELGLTCRVLERQLEDLTA